MAVTRAEKIVAFLKELHTNTPDVEAAALISVDGLIMASVLPAGVQEDHVAAMSAAMLSLGERSSQELGRGDLERVLVKGAQGYIVLASAGREAVVTVLTSERAKLGMVFLDLSRAAKKISEVL